MQKQASETIKPKEQPKKNNLKGIKRKSPGEPASETSYDTVLGGQWGDEGKAKMVDYLSCNYDIIVRYQGGANAGHTIVWNDQKFILHHLPSGVFTPKTKCLLGQGMVINLETLCQEIEAISGGKPLTNKEVKEKIFISQNAFLVLDYHIEVDKAIEEKKKNKIGTTIKGIGPAYNDKVARIGIRLQDLFFPRLFKEKVTSAIEKNRNLLNTKKYDASEIAGLVEKNLFYFKKIKDQVIDTTYYLQEQKNKKILFEGAQGLGLDLDLGTYPYVTSSSPSSGGASPGTGVPPNKLKEVVGIFKAYITRVGAGPLPTKLAAKELKTLRELGDEFGATTGRPRDCGWFDLVQARYSIMVNGITKLAITKLDILDKLEKFKVAVAYEYKGEKTKRFPIHPEILKRVKPIYREFKVWKKPTYKVSTFAGLPPEAKRFIAFLEKELDCPVAYISTGPGRNDTIVR